MTSFVITYASLISDVFALSVDVIAFFWRHFFDILELLFTLAFIALVVVILVGIVGVFRETHAATDVVERWRRSRAVPGSEDRAREPDRRGPESDNPWRVEARPRTPKAVAPSTRRPSASSTARTRSAPPTAAPKRPATTTPGRPQRAVQKCTAENNKTVFSTAAKADAKVEQSKKRYALHGGQPPLDHSYRCPHGDHWHVSSKERY